MASRNVSRPENNIGLVRLGLVFSYFLRKRNAYMHNNVVQFISRQIQMYLAEIIDFIRYSRVEFDM